MKNWKCTFCKKEFLRYQSQVRNPDKVFCSTICKGHWQTENSKGDRNPNFKSGVYSKLNFCVCGLRKDYRAKRCSKCSNKSFSIGKKNTVDEDTLLSVIRETTSLLEAAEKMKLTRATLTKYVKERGVDISHFKPGRNRSMSNDRLFSVGSVSRNGIVKGRILKQKLKENKCELCNQVPYWNNKPLLLEMDHINGNPKDNRLENLRLLCPNCHSQTSTYCGKNMRKNMSQEETEVPACSSEKKIFFTSDTH